SCPPLGALWRMYTSRFSSRLTSGLSRTPRTSVKIAALAPMPSASVRITMAARPLLRISEWNAILRSRKNDMFLLPSAFLRTARATRPPSSRGSLSPPLLADLFDFAHVPRWPNLERRPIPHCRMLGDELNCVIQISRFQHQNSTQLLFRLDVRTVC